MKSLLYLNELIYFLKFFPTFTKDLLGSYPIPLIFLSSKAFKNCPDPAPISKTFIFDFMACLNKSTLGKNI